MTNLLEDRLTWAATVIFFLSLILLSIIQVEDTDIWVHLSIGREIFNLHHIPVTQSFTFPSDGQEFRYASFLFGLILYVAYLAGGYVGLVMLKSSIVCLAMLILYRDALQPYYNRLVALLALILFVMFSRERFVERPDIVVMVLIAFTIFALNAYIYRGKKYLYTLPLVAFIWSACHSSIVLILVPYIAFIVGGIIQNLMHKVLRTSCCPTWVQIKTVSVVCVFSLASTLINPYPFSQFTLGYRGLASTWGQRHIVELGPLLPSGQVVLWFVIVLTLITFYLNRKNFSFIHLLLVLPFFALPFLARRFLFLFCLVAAPVIARNISNFLSESPSRIPSRMIINPITISLVIVFIITYTALGLLGKPPVGYEFKKFGVGVNESRVPVGSVHYMDENGVFGRVFNPFNWGGYIIWTGYPGRTVFIDPMGGLPDELLDKYIHAKSGILGSTWVLEQLYANFGFEAIVLDYPYRYDGESDLSGLVLSDPKWALVFWDDTSLLYLRRGGAYQHLIDRDEYRFVIPAARRSAINCHLDDPVTLERIESDIKRSIRRNPTATGLGLLGHICNVTGRYHEAIAHYTKVPAYSRQNESLYAYSGLGSAYYSLGNFDQARMYYEKALKIHKEGIILYSLATVYVAMGNDVKAAESLREAIRLSPEMEVARTLLEITNSRLIK